MLVKCGRFAGKMCSNAGFRHVIIRIGKISDEKNYSELKYALLHLDSFRFIIMKNYVRGK